MMYTNCKSRWNRSSNFGEVVQTRLLFLNKERLDLDDVSPSHIPARRHPVTQSCLLSFKSCLSNGLSPLSSIIKILNSLCTSVMIYQSIPRVLGVYLQQSRKNYNILHMPVWIISPNFVNGQGIKNLK